MLISGIEILNKAHKENYAVGAFNINNLEMAQAIFEAADEISSPIIIEASELFCKLSKYSKDELIGNSHNIIRHPNMPGEIFLIFGIQYKMEMFGKVRLKIKLKMAKVIGYIQQSYHNIMKKMKFMNIYLYEKI